MINLNIGLTVPNSMQLLADEVLNEAARVHHTSRRHGGGVAVVGTRAAGGNAGDRNLGSGSSSAFAGALGTVPPRS
jgi:hypothetical protein